MFCCHLRRRWILFWRELKNWKVAVDRQRPAWRGEDVAVMLETVVQRRGVPHSITRDGLFVATWDALDWGTPEDALPSCGVGASTSTDGGRSWSEAVLTGTPCDGPKVTSNPNTGTVYGHSSSFIGPRSTGNPDTPFGDISTRWLVSSTDGVN